MSFATTALRQVYHHTDRMLIAEFSGNPVTTVIVVYSPTNVAPSEEVEKFFEDLETAVRDVPAHNFMAILGDFNARLGPEDAPFPYHDSTNRNGAYLMEHTWTYWQRTPCSGKEQARDGPSEIEPQVCYASWITS